MDRWRTETIKRLCELTASLLASGLSAPREQIDAALSFPAIRGVLGQSLAEPLQSALFAATRGRISAPINTEPTLMVRVHFILRSTFDLDSLLRFTRTRRPSTPPWMSFAA